MSISVCWALANVQAPLNNEGVSKVSNRKCFRGFADDGVLFETVGGNHRYFPSTVSKMNLERSGEFIAPNILTIVQSNDTCTWPDA